MTTTANPELVPARMLNEYAYCPRLAYLEWVQGEFEDSVDTVEGRFQHRRVDRPSGTLPVRSADLPDDDGDEHETIHARSVMLSDNSLGAVARIDLIEGRGNVDTPWTTSMAKPPMFPRGLGTGTSPSLHPGLVAPGQRIHLQRGNALLRRVPPAGNGPF